MITKAGSTERYRALKMSHFLVLPHLSRPCDLAKHHSWTKGCDDTPVLCGVTVWAVAVLDLRLLVFQAVCGGRRGQDHHDLVNCFWSHRRELGAPMGGNPECTVSPSIPVTSKGVFEIFHFLFTYPKWRVCSVCFFNKKMVDSPYCRALGTLLFAEVLMPGPYIPQFLA